MVRKLIEWALNSPLIVLIIVVSLAVGGFYSFKHINVEAYPDPAPAIIEVVAQWPGASAEEMERLVTVPLEITLAGMPGLKATHSRSLFGLTHLRNVFHYGHDYNQARQEVINRLQMITQPLPAGVTPLISPASPIGEIYRYTLSSPKNAVGQEIYTLNDLKALQDWLVEREFRRVPRIIDVTSSGGTVKRYEVQPDPERLKRFGITLAQMQNALANSNANVGGDFLVQGRTVQMVRCVGVIGGGKDPMERAFAMKTSEEAARFLREADQTRLSEIRDIVITSINNVPIRIDDVVQGGPLPYSEAPSTQGVIVSHQTRLGRVSFDKAFDPAGKTWSHSDEKVQGIVLMRKGEQSLPSLEGVKAKVRELNQPGRLLPGVSLEPYYDREELVHLTTHTVEHNLILGMVLVTVILLMFLNNVRSALIVAINIPLALLFAFTVLFLRGQSANLLSIGAVDFGIIVDSAVIMVENIYRHLSAGEHSELPLKERILMATREIDKALLFSTAIMVCAFIPLFTMQGAEGELFGPMAQTYAFALGGALLLTLTLAPVLCLMFFKKVKPVQDNIMVRFMKARYLTQLRLCLKYRSITVTVMASIIIITAAWPLVHLGREFMPELEEGNLWVRAIFPVHVSLDAVADPIRKAREIMSSAAYPEVEAIMVQSGRPDDGTDPGGFNNVELFVPLKAEKNWPVVKRPNGEIKVRTRHDIITDMSQELSAKLPGIEWAFSQYIRDNVMEAISGVKGDNSVKIYGPDLDELERLAEKVKNQLAEIRGLYDLGIYRIMGQSNFEFAVDKDKCKRYGVQVADVNNVINSAVHGAPFTQMYEGEKTFDVTLRWPMFHRQDQSSILEIPVDIGNNSMSQGSIPGTQQTTTTGPQAGPSPTGTGNPNPALVSSAIAPYNSFLPRLRLRDLVSPVDENGRANPDPRASFSRPGGSMITREQGKRFIAVKFSVRDDRDLASAVAEVQDKTRHIVQAPYRVAFGGEFEQMQDAEGCLMIIIPASLALIFVLLYVAFRSILDVVVILSNVFDLAVGGIWALYLTNTNFSISAAVGFVSLFGVAIMDGLLMISYFNDLRAKGLPVTDAIMHGAALRVRPVTMTALTAILGLLPAAFSTAIGAQTQRPLAIVVVGGMITTLFLTRYLMPVLYSFYGHREPVEGASSMAH
ncbi:MAG TPA: efflux RND transporter permease subunit [Gemmataceae bacterium]|nr:efflux RND transporter permease subunit [Gemmataceae bacterium]